MDKEYKNNLPDNSSIKEIKNFIKSRLNPKYYDLLENEEEIDKYIIKIESKIEVTNNMLENKSKKELKWDPYECIKILSEYYKNIEYYKTILVDAKKVKLPYYFTLENYKKMNRDNLDKLDDILLQYIRFSKNMVPIIIWPTISSENFFKKKESKEFVDYLNKNGTIEIVKYMNVTKKQSESLIYQIYKSLFLKNYKNIKDNIDNKCLNQKDNLIIFIFWKPTKNNTYYFGDGDDNKGKQILRKLLLNQEKQKGYVGSLDHIKSTKDQEYNTKCLMHITDNEIETIELAQLVFNRNSFEFMSLQRIDLLSFRYDKFTRSILIINLYKRIIYKYCELIDINRFLSFSSIILFGLGLRNINDIDAFFYYLPKIEKSKSKDLKMVIDDFICEFLGGKKRQIMEFTTKDYGCWKPDNHLEYPHDWFEKELPNSYGAKNHEDAIFNPRNFFYFLGIKCIHYKGDIYRRQKRMRPASISDLIAINKMTYLKVKIPEIPEKIWIEHKEMLMTEEKKKSLIYKVINYLKNRYKIEIKYEEIKEILNIKY